MFLISILDGNQCDPNPCLHGGNCTDKVGGFHCSCPTPHYGPICELETAAEIKEQSKNTVNKAVYRGKKKTQKLLQSTSLITPREVSWICWPIVTAIYTTSNTFLTILACCFIVGQSWSNVRLKARQHVSSNAQPPSSPSPAPALLDSDCTAISAVVCQKV